MLRRFLPTNLFGRALLILVVPTVLIQLVTAYIFLGRHVENLSRHMSNALTGEVTFLVHELRPMDVKQKEHLVSVFTRMTGIFTRFETGESEVDDVRTPLFPEFTEQLELRLKHPFSLHYLADESLLLRIKLNDGVLRLQFSSKRLTSGTTHIFLAWMIGSAVLFLFIAILFLRNQIRPISRLAQAAENFGRGLDNPDFKPQGATEVRRAARAFIIMRERIKRQIRTRTEMLAGISHDLRTPLTRMKLQLEMLPSSPEHEDMKADVLQMEHMIQEYLDFTRGEGREESRLASLDELLNELADSYKRSGHHVILAACVPMRLPMRVGEIRRVLNNLIDNAIRYGKECVLSARESPGYYEIIVDDDGSGIPPAQRNEVFKPFKRLDPSRNTQTGGVGLGLSIVRDIVLGHGGAIWLEESPKKGLRVVVRLPR